MGGGQGAGQQLCTGAPTVSPELSYFAAMVAGSHTGVLKQGLELFRGGIEEMMKEFVQGKVGWGCPISVNGVCTHGDRKGNIF